MKYLLSLGVICLLILAFLPPQQRTIEGTVLDEQNKPLPGVTVTVKGTQTGTLTDSAGNFTITVNKDRPILIFSSVGFKSKEYSVKNETVLNITLSANRASLSEVVVTGYSSKLKKTMRGRQPSATYAAPYLQGSVAGIAAVRDMAANSYDRNEEYKQYGNADTVQDFNREGYDKITETPFFKVTGNPLSTFSIDVDAASYSNVRRFITDGQLPPAGAVRIEEMINYFTYQYPQPANDAPFSINTELAACPWNSQHQLMLIGLQGKTIPTDNLPVSNLVFLIDVSGSMADENKLPLVQASLKLLVDQLRPQDKVALVVYAGNAGLVLPPTAGDRKATIKDAISRLEAGGSTAGGAGIKLAYATAKKNFAAGGNNRVILCTDGDFNVGLSSDDALETLIEHERESGIFLTVLGYGMGNYQDAKMQKLADKGNGNHAYIDGMGEAKKVLVNEFGGTLFTIAKDVKLQLEFNPQKVQSYRLIGYENRMLAKEDFNNDTKDAGELGSGHTVTALYEIIPAGIQAAELDSVDALRYQTTKSVKLSPDFGNELLNIKLRYKQPDGNSSKLLQQPVSDNSNALAATSDNFRFAAAVAEFGMLLRNSKYKGDAGFGEAKQLALKAVGNDKEGYRREFIQLVEAAGSLKAKEVAKAE